MRINDQFAIATLFTTFSAPACEPVPDDPGRSESTTGSGSAVETDGMSETGSPTTSTSSSSDTSTGSTSDSSTGDQQSGTSGSAGSTSNTCIDASPPAPGELYGPCKGPEHACNDGLICQVADDPDPQFPKGTMCLTTCWGAGNDGTCPEALDSCGEPFAKSACQSATDPLRPVPCELPCTSDIDCANEGMRCFLDRCVWEGL